MLVSVTANWADALRQLRPAMQRRGWSDGIDLVQSVPEWKLDGAIGRYCSFDHSILLNEEYSGDHPKRILLHEIGHHLHYRKVLGTTDEFDRQQWNSWCEKQFVSRDGNEYVAWQFARFHEGRRGDDWDAELYEKLNGPELTEPLIDSVK
jgi:hypothetical protein